MSINLKQIGKDILTAYIVIAVDVLEGFKTNFNIISWSSNKVAKFLILFGVITLINLIVLKFKKKLNRD
tara:strand:- start:1757 stop:1963 length:207 start_codon:yes stop_codon:yes gene_type:complete